MKYRNIFVLSTGRSGSEAFIKACEHLENYSAGHETLSSKLGDARFAYPDFHIESDNRLSWLLGRLDAKFGDSAFYVHLKRNPKATAISFSKRHKGGILSAYQGMGIIMGCNEKDQTVIAEDYIHTVNTNIEFFLRNKNNKMNFILENAESDFKKFCSLVSANGNIECALEEFKIRHNSSEHNRKTVRKILKKYLT